ncbi:VOC family protein [Catalinimonas niigatensis]|uniref:VOC family protein n=1 Tax=Catalinimonas niigatensis TaxID=1397264 RepID=UPI0026651B44|nr:VOC family protein [Catalinimonas niigatensis]WPP53031.1 VOC family protein [Catalinimonas niigatensis]
MKKVNLNPYLFFDANCREAMQFYQNIFGGELTVQTFGELDKSTPEDLKDRVMHANLMGGEVEFFASDAMDSSPLGSGKISMTLHGSDEEKLRKMFEQLSEGGKVNQALERQVWGDIYGDLIDKYDVNWMVNIGTEKE